MQSLFEWALAIISSGGLGAAITYVFTFKAKQQQALAEAESTEIDVEHKKEDLKQDQYDFLQKTCDKYIKDYHTLENDFRKQLQILRDEMDKIAFEKSKAISDKCTEIAELKSKVTYLKGIRCYNFTCQHRIKQSPEDVHREISQSNN